MGSDLGSGNAKLDTQFRVGLGASNFVFRVQFWRVQFLGWPCPLSGLGAPILTRSSFCRFQFGGESNLRPAQSLAYPILTACPIDCVSNFQTAQSRSRQVENSYEWRKDAATFYW